MSSIQQQHGAFEWVSLPIRDSLWICRLDAHGATTPVAPLTIEMSNDLPMERRDVPGIRDATCSPDGWVAVRSGGGKALHVFKADTMGAVGQKHVFLPGDLELVHDCAFVGDVLFVVGKPRTNPSTRAGWFDLKQRKSKWQQLELPMTNAEVGAPAVKIQTFGNRMVVIDASSTPKQALLYDVTDPLSARLIEAVRIPSGIDDKIIDVAVSRSFLGILSQSHHRDGKAWKFGIYDRERLDEVSTFFHRADWSAEFAAPTGAVGVDDVFLLSHGIRGLGAIRLQDQEATRFPQLEGLRPWSNPYLPLEDITYYAPLGPGRVVHAIPLSQTGKALVVIRQGTRSWWEVVTL